MAPSLDDLYFQTLALRENLRDIVAGHDDRCSSNTQTIEVDRIIFKQLLDQIEPVVDFFHELRKGES